MVNLMNKTNSAEFIKFYDALMASAPHGYKPWLFPVVAEDKYPDPLATFQLAGPKSSCCDAPWKYVVSAQNTNKSYWACEKCLSARASWKAPHACMSKQQCIDRLNSGGNIGFAARANDPIIIIDLDDENIPDIKPTLSLQSRSRKGRHRIGLAGDDKIKTNISTGTFGELRSLDEYIVAPGSFVPVLPESIAKLPEDQRPLAGCYTVDKVLPLATLLFNDLPDVFKQTHEQTMMNATQAPSLVNPFTIPDKHSAVFDLKIKNIVSINQTRDKHPAHESETGGNFSADENVAICWRHNMAHNAIHLLAVLSGKYSCEQVGKKLKGLSIPIDDGQIFWAWHEAKKRGIIPIDDPVPIRAMLYIAREYKLRINDDNVLPVKTYNEVLEIIRRDY